jgi:hypothetical protein
MASRHIIETYCPGGAQGQQGVGACHGVPRGRGRPSEVAQRPTGTARCAICYLLPEITVVC